MAIGALGVSIASTLPVYAQIRWQNVGPGGGGWIECLAIDPLNPEIVYAGCDVGGVFKSYDGGKKWLILNNGLENDFVRDICIDPKNPDTIYVATLGGVHKSVDGGRNWVIKRKGFPPVSSEDFSAPVNTLAMDPNNSSILYAGIGNRDTYGKGQIYKSINGGESWFLVNLQNEINPNAVVHSICIDKRNSQYIYIGTDYGVYNSSDGGKHWIGKNKGLPHLNVRKVIISKVSPYRLYLSLRTSSQESNFWQGGVYCSDDEGENWRVINQVFSSDSSASNYYPIEVDPINPDICYVGDVSWQKGGLYKTDDAGRTWIKCTDYKNIKDYGWLTNWGISVNCIAVASSNPQVIFIGTSGHIFKSNDTGKSWQQVYTNLSGGGTYTTRGLETTCIHSITIDPHSPNTIYIGYFDIGLMKTTDGGKSFKRIVQGMDYENSTFSVVIDPDNSSVLYAGIGEWSENKGSFCKSQNGGGTWSVMGKSSALPDGRVRFICIDPQSPIESRHIYIGIDGQGIFKSKDGGEYWVSLNNGINFQDIRALLLRPGNPNILYAAVGRNNQEMGGIYMSENEGRTWKGVNTNIEFPNIQCMTFAPNDVNVLYVGSREYFDHQSNQYFSGGLFRSLDGGRSWMKVFEDKFISAVAVVPSDSNTLYVSCSDHNYHDLSRGRGVYQSEDNGKTWQMISKGLGSRRINALVVSETKPHILYCGTAGNGLFIGLKE